MKKLIDILKIVHSNRRITYRDKLNITGRIIIQYENKITETIIQIVNISYNGIQVVFSDNDFLFKYLELIDNPESSITVKFEYEEINYSFQNKIKWIRLYKTGEKNYHVLTCLTYITRENFEKDLLNLITIIQMQNFYI